MTQALTTAIRERERELELIGAALDSVQRGHGRLLFFEGSPGIGKTRLLNEILEQARAADVDVLCARGGELEREFPFGLVRQLFEPRLASASEEERSMLLAGAARLCAPLVSHELSAEPLGLRASLGAGRIGGQAAGDVPYATLHGLYWLSANLAAERPLLVAIDDAHWADAPSLRWASYLAGRLEGLPILVAVTTRSADPRAEGELLATLASSPSAEVIYPGPLSEAAVAELVRETFGPDAVDDYCRACHQVAAGNPFLLRELVAELASLGVTPTEAGVAEVHHVSPKGLSRSVLRRLARLPAEADALARAVAVLGARAEPRHAAALCDFGEALAAEAADHLAQADILHRGAPFRFVHPVVRTAIYDDLPTSERFRSHLRAARILDADGASGDQVAAHLLATQPSDDRWVVDALRKTAKAALETGIPTAAISYLRRALTEPPPPDDMPELLTELGRAEARAGDPSAVEHLSQALELTGDARRRGVVALELGRALHMAGRVTETVSVLSRAGAELASIDDALALRVEAELISAARMDRRTAPIVAERLSRLGGEVTGRAPAERVLLANLAFAAVIRGQPAETGTELAKRALGDGALLAEEGTESMTFYLTAWTLALCDRLEDADRPLEAAVSAAREHGSALGVAWASCFRSNVAYRRGAVLDAESEARGALDLPTEEGWLGQPLAIAFLVDALIERGDLDAVADILARSRFERPVRDSIVYNAWLYSRGRLGLVRGKYEPALQDFLACGERESVWGVRTPAFFPWRSNAAVALSRLERPSEAQTLAAEEIELARAFEAPRALSIALRAGGLIAVGEEGQALLAEAVEVLEGREAPLERARALVDYGAALRRANQRSAARERLRAGLELAEGSGAIPLAERARTELAATGARPRRVVRSGLDELTPSERRVAKMAVEGFSNREIAQALFVTVKTVEWHLGQTYGKLGVRSRTDLPAALAY